MIKVIAALRQKEWCSLVTNVVLDGVNASIKADSVLLDDDFLLDKSIDLLFEEVALVHVVLLELLVVFFKVRDIFDDLLQDIIGSLGSMML